MDSPAIAFIHRQYRTLETVVQCDLVEVASLYIYMPDPIALNESSIPYYYHMYKHYYQYFLKAALTYYHRQRGVVCFLAKPNRS
jgi:hypothetical protein